MWSYMWTLKLRVIKNLVTSTHYRVMTILVVLILLFPCFRTFTHLGHLNFNFPSDTLRFTPYSFISTDASSVLFWLASIDSSSAGSTITISRFIVFCVYQNCVDVLQQLFLFNNIHMVLSTLTWSSFTSWIYVLDIGAPKALIGRFRRQQKCSGQTRFNCIIFVFCCLGVLRYVLSSCFSLNNVLWVAVWAV